MTKKRLEFQWSKPKPKKQKQVDGNERQDARDERDGMTPVRVSWREKIVAALQPFGTGQWFTQAALLRAVKDRYQDTPQELTHEVYGLVRTGHLERAIKPDQIKAGYRPRQEYIYRRTAKAFVPTKIRPIHGKAVDLERARQIQLDNPRLPKWFRIMMTY